MALNQNQFAQTPVAGMLDLMYNPATISAIVNSASAFSGGLVPSQAVKLADAAGAIPQVIECALDSDDVFGFVNYNIKNASFDPGQALEISAFRDNVMFMTASAAITPNAKVAIVVASNKIVTATTGMRIIGRALDKATADGDIIRVMIDLPGALA